MITKLQSLSQGTAGNMTGADIATAVNALIDSSVDYKGSLSNIDVNTAIEAGYYVVLYSGMTNNPPFDENYFLEVHPTDGNWCMQVATSLTNPDNRYVRVIRPSLTTYPEWQRVNKSKLHGKKILFLGDSIMESYTIPHEIGQATGAEIINCAIGGTRMGRTGSGVNGDGYRDCGGWRIAEAIDSGDWSTVRTAVEYLRDSKNDNNIAQLELLENLDFSTVDILVVSYGTNDFTGGWTTLGTPTDEDISDPDGTATTWSAHWNNFLKRIRAKYPNIKILCLSPIWRRTTPTDTAGIVGGSDVSPDLLDQYLYQYGDSLHEICKRHKVEYHDMYRTSGIDELTHTHYLGDELHPNLTGAKMLAGKIQGLIESKF